MQTAIPTIMQVSEKVFLCLLCFKFEETVLAVLGIDSNPTQLHGAERCLRQACVGQVKDPKPCKSANLKLPAKLCKGLPTSLWCAPPSEP